MGHLSGASLADFKLSLFIKPKVHHDMSTTTPPIMVHFTSDSVTDPTRRVATVTKQPYTRASLPPGLSPQQTQDFNAEENKKCLQNVVVVFKEPSDCECLPLPAIQPDRPEAWEADAWDNRYVLGNADFHLYSPGIYDDDKRNPPFILKVSAARDGSETVYEDIGPMTTELDEKLCTFIAKVRAGAQELKSGLGSYPTWI